MLCLWNSCSGPNLLGLRLLHCWCVLCLWDSKFTVSYSNYKWEIFDNFFTYGLIEHYEFKYVLVLHPWFYCAFYREGEVLEESSSSLICLLFFKGGRIWGWGKNLALQLYILKAFLYVFFLVNWYLFFGFC